jgi:hypothetical protein
MYDTNKDRFATAIDMLFYQKINELLKSSLNCYLICYNNYLKKKKTKIIGIDTKYTHINYNLKNIQL